MKRMIAAAVAVIALAGVASAQGPIRGVVAPGCSSCGAAAPAGPVGFGGYAAAPMGGGCGEGGCGNVGGGGCRECDPRFGVNPFFKRLLFWRRASNCNSCGRVLGGGRGNNCAGQPTGAAGLGAGAGANPYPDGVPGTLVYPYNPYIRSPRDWFMTEK